MHVFCLNERYKTDCNTSCNTVTVAYVIDPNIRQRPFIRHPYLTFYVVSEPFSYVLIGIHIHMYGNLVWSEMDALCDYVIESPISPTNVGVV